VVLDLINSVSRWAVPLMIFAIFIYGYFKGVPIFDTFVEGAQEGLMISVKILPYLIAVYVAVGIFRESGAVRLFIYVFKPVLEVLGIPPEILLVSITRSLSGPAALGMAAEIFDTYGPDSFIGRLASCVIGSTDTTFYILAVYFASVGIKKTKYAIPVGLMADMAGLLGSVYIVNRVFMK